MNSGAVSDGYHTFDELYEHRQWLFEALSRVYRECAWISRKHADGSGFDGWFVAGIDFPNDSQISYHLPDSMWDVMAQYAIEHERAPWDGHTAAQVVERLRQRAGA